MAKKKEEKVESSFLANVLKANEEKFGERVYLAHESDRKIFGIPLTSLALMYVIDSTVLPLNKIIGIAGYPASHKSSLGFDFMRMVCDCGGYGNLVETENKMSPSLIRSLLRQHYDSKRVFITQAADINEAQTAMTQTLTAVKKNDENRKQLFGMMLDSLTGADTEETVNKLFDEGSLGRSFPTAALSWTGFFKGWCGSLIDWPILFLFINHLKEKASQTGGPPSETTPGGAAQRFHASIYLFMKTFNNNPNVRQTVTIGGKIIKRLNRTRTIRIACHKNSLGDNGRQIVVDFTWYNDDQDNQVSYFDWDEATAVMLAAMQSDKSRDVDKKGLRDIVDVSERSGEYSSSVLGVKGITGNELGHAVHSNPKLMAELIRFFPIKQHPVFDQIPAQPLTQEAPAPTAVANHSPSQSAGEPPPPSAVPSKDTDEMGV